MKRFLLGGLSIALLCLVARVDAEEIQWRPASSGQWKPRQRADVSFSPSAARGQDGPAPSLGEPVPSPTGLRPVAYSQKEMPSVKPALQPLPVGEPGDEPPVLPPNSEEVEVVPLPKPMERKSKSIPGPIPPDVPPGALLGDVPPPGYVEGMPPDAVVAPDWSCCDESCGVETDCWGCCFTNCCGLPKIWGRAEYLLWGVKDGNLPPLATATTLTQGQLLALAAGDPNFRPGALGQPGTMLLFGGTDDETFPTFSGGRFTLGISGLCQQCGIETTYFFLSERTRYFNAASPGQPGLFRPFVDVNQGVESSEFVAFPGLLAGALDVQNPLRLWGLEFNIRKPWHCGCNYKVDFLAGFRYLDLQESLIIRESPTFTRSGTVTTGGRTIMVTAGDNINIEDSFEVRNRFYGGQVGAEFEYRTGRWIFGVNGKIGLGTMHQTASITGTTQFNLANGTQLATNQGFLAQPTNIGWYSQDRFAVVPEVGVKIGYQVTDNLSVYAGYNFLYISDVVRAGDIVDRGVNTTQLPSVVNNQLVPGMLQGQPRPAFIFRTTDFWAQGLNVGMELKY